MVMETAFYQQYSIHSIVLEMLYLKFLYIVLI